MEAPARRVFVVAILAFVSLLPESALSISQTSTETPEAQFDKGMAHAQAIQPNYAEAAKFFRAAADRGLAKAQRSLGELYQSGLGVTKNVSEAAKWFRKAAEQGDARAQSNLGNMYSGGIGVKKDDTEAVKWLQKAADQGDASGQFALGTMMAGGRGVSRDPRAALEWFRKAAGQGFAPAQFALGTAYEVGFGGFEMSLEQAAAWYTKAAAQGLEPAKAALQQLAADDIAPSPAGSAVRIGGDVAQSILISSPKPSYPSAARSGRVSGVVLFQAVISRTGRVKSLKVIGGHPLLNEASMEAVRQWRYKPHSVNGQPVEFLTTVTVNFTFVQ